MQRRPRPEALDHGFEQRQLRELVVGALHEQHRDLDIGEVFGAIVGRLAGRMQRKAEKRQPVDAGERRCRLRLRGHAAAEGSAAGDQAQPGAASPGFGHRGAHGGVRDRRRVGPLAALLHIGKLIAQRRHAAFGQALGGGLHGGVGHPGPGAMGKHKARAGIGGTDQQRGDRARIADRDLELLRTDDFHLIPSEFACRPEWYYAH